MAERYPRRTRAPRIDNFLTLWPPNDINFTNEEEEEPDDSPDSSSDVTDVEEQCDNDSEQMILCFLSILSISTLYILSVLYRNDIAAFTRHIGKLVNTRGIS